jgi:ABC-type sugar transport system ATPase subunit
VKRLRDEGLAIIYISHRMAEVYALADRVTVLRDGSFVGELAREEIDSERIVQMMVGRSLGEFYQHTRMAPERAAALPVVLQVQDLAGGKVKPSSFAVRAGEVLGFAGLVAGRTELARLLFGADRAAAVRSCWMARLCRSMSRARPCAPVSPTCRRTARARACSCRWPWRQRHHERGRPPQPAGTGAQRCPG